MLGTGLAFADMPLTGGICIGAAIMMAALEL